MKYAVKIKEVLQRTVIVDVDGDFHDAKEKAYEAYENCEVVLYAEDFGGVEFEASETFGEEPIAEDDKRLEIFTKL